MTPRGPRNRIKADEVYGSFQLRDRATDFLSSKYDIGNDIYPDTDASLLRNHLFGDDDGSAEKNTESQAGILERVITFMSTEPLLRGFNAAEDSTSYAALRNRTQSQTQKSFSQMNQRPPPMMPARETSEDKSTAVRAVTSFASLGSKRRRDENAFLGSATNLFFSLRYRAPVGKVVGDIIQASG